MTASPTTPRSGPIFEAIAAKVDGTPCCTYVGADGAGHYVKMVHNGIEYADMQLIAESYDLLRNGVGWEVPQIAERFERWNTSELESFLIEISARVLSKTDEATGMPLVDVILDAAEQKGTGRWTAQDALELGVPLTGITEAVFARGLSALKDQRVHAADVLKGPGGNGVRSGDDSLADDLEHALYASKIVSYAQGFAQMAAAADTEGWDINLGSMATIWRGGCIIRARFLDRIREAYDAEPGLANLCSPTSSPPHSPTPRIRGGAWSPRQPSWGSPRRRSHRRWPTTTATAALAARPA